MLLNEINREFCDVVYPGDAGLADSYPNEWEPTLRNLHGKDWRCVESRDFDSQGGMIEGIQALGLKGFIYFLPGLIRISLIDADSRYMIVSALLTRFTVPDSLAQSLAIQKKILASLSPARRSLLIRFFSVIRESEPLLCPVLIDSAISNLKAGDVTPYKEEDVKKWVCRFA